MEGNREPLKRPAEDERDSLSIVHPPHFQKGKLRPSGQGHCPSSPQPFLRALYHPQLNGHCCLGQVLLGTMGVAAKGAR